MIFIFNKKKLHDYWDIPLSLKDANITQLLLSAHGLKSEINTLSNNAIKEEVFVAEDGGGAKSG